LGERVWIAFHSSGVKLFGRFDLFGRKVGRTGDCRPGRGGVAAAKKLIVLGFVALGAIGCRKMLGDHEAAMVERGLSLHGLVAVEAGDALGGVLTRFKLVDDGRCLLPMAFGALSDGSSCGRRRLPSFDVWPTAVNDEGRDDQRGGKDNSDEHTSKSHDATPKNSISELGARLRNGSKNELGLAPRSTDFSPFPQWLWQVVGQALA
jgi:hypothetical protein